MKKKYAALIFCAIGLLLGSVTSEAKKRNHRLLQNLQL